MQSWYVHDKGATAGPFTMEQVKEQIASGKLGADATFCVSGSTTFRPLADVPELAPAKPTELPVVAQKKCCCPVARFGKRLIVAALLALVAYVVYVKLGGHCCHAVKAF